MAHSLRIFRTTAMLRSTSSSCLWLAPVCLMLVAAVAVSIGVAAEGEEAPVKPEELTELIRQADLIVVYNNPGYSSDSPPKELYRSTAKKDITAFGEAAVVKKGDWFSCRCGGTLAVYLFRGDDQLVSLTNHHGVSVRCSLWSGDADLKDGKKWVKWFDDRKMPGPRIEVEEMEAQWKQDELDRAKWLAAMPKSLVPLWDKARREMNTELNLKPLVDALAKEFPDNRQRGLALFHWYGSGEGPWSGYHGYETLANKLLQEIPSSDIIAAVRTEKLTDTQLEGAARFFEDWAFEQPPDNSRALPPEVKKKLLEHALKSPHEFNREAAKRVFE